ncbi:hypothetical protein QR680_008378 [Steinernema hermaphroditum]|uniref:DUF19 domain-containing protein n=1 Tax=Steinernema hermaphroditum TaxID=289476 RepID=A0AA39IIE0_9BILA|nr:hypothetical protein QR680_008378 [Steinernema hermaphroditum]
MGAFPVFLLASGFLVSHVTAMDSRTFWACVDNPSLAYCPDIPIKDPRKAKTTTTTTPAPVVEESTVAVKLAPNDFLIQQAPVDKAQVEKENEECMTLQSEFKSVCSRKPPKGAELETITFCNMYKQQCLAKRPVATAAPIVEPTTNPAKLVSNDLLIPQTPADKAEAERQSQECISLQSEFKSVCSRKPPKGAELETITFCNMYKQQCLVKKPRRS